MQKKCPVMEKNNLHLTYELISFCVESKFVLIFSDLLCWVKLNTLFWDCLIWTFDFDRWNVSSCLAFVFWFRVWKADSESVDVCEQRGCQSVWIQKPDPEICPQIYRLQVSFSSSSQEALSFRWEKLSDWIKSLLSAASRTPRSSCASCWTASTTRWTGRRSGERCRPRKSTTSRKPTPSSRGYSASLLFFC